MQLHGRSSSHFTRIPRMFAAELELALDFHPIRDVMSVDPEHYGGHPALKLPTLATDSGTWYGALPICRELARRSELSLDILWPEDLDRAIASNAQELVSVAMATEVALIMGGSGGVPADNAHAAKQRASLIGAMAWLEQNWERALDTLPAERDLSVLEVSLFCLVEHLEFRKVLPLDPYPALLAFAGRYGRRSSARATPYVFDFPQA